MLLKLINRNHCHWDSSLQKFSGTPDGYYSNGAPINQSNPEAKDNKKNQTKTVDTKKKTHQPRFTILFISVPKVTAVVNQNALEECISQQISRQIRFRLTNLLLGKRREIQYSYAGRFFFKTTCVNN